ncbi:MAG: AAA family ATPase [Acidimicrobiia bacterium]
MTPPTERRTTKRPTAVDSATPPTTEETTQLPGCWRDVVDALAAGIDRLVLFGPPGTGKTYGGLTLGDVTGGAHRLICNEDMTAADVTGHFMPTADGNWKWHEGSVLKAWKGDGTVGGRVVADEIDRSSGDVLSILLNMFDTVDSATWQHPDTGETVRPLSGFSVVMTTNIEDMRDLPTALKDRFPVAIRIDQPHPGALAKLSPYLRAPATASAAADKARRFSVRSFMAFDRLRTSGMDLERAAFLIFGNHAKDILDAIRVDSVGGGATKKAS